MAASCAAGVTSAGPRLRGEAPGLGLFQTLLEPRQEALDHFGTQLGRPENLLVTNVKSHSFFMLCRDC